MDRREEYCDRGGVTEREEEKRNMFGIRMKRRKTRHGTAERITIEGCG